MLAGKSAVGQRFLNAVLIHGDRHQNSNFFVLSAPAASQADTVHVIFPHAAGAVSRDRNRTEIAKAPPVFRRGFWAVAKRKESDQYFCSGAYFSCSASSRSRSDSMRLWRARICNVAALPCSLIPTPPDDEQSPGIFHIAGSESKFRL